MRRSGLGLILAAALALAASACSDAYFQRRAIKTAGNEHRCRRVTIKNVVSEDRMGGDFAYWLNVCGEERLYRMDATTGQRFVDQTGSVR